MEAKLKETKILINSILTASENSLSLGQLEAEYKILENEYIPFKEFGFKSLLEFLQNCSDIVRIIHVGGTAQLLPIVGDESRHIRDLVENQKKDPSKKVSYKITHAVEENILRLLGRTPDHKLPVGRLSSFYMKSYGKPLPSPKGKLVAWLGTSNRFAVLPLDKHGKIIEPLSTVDMSRYKPSSSLSESSLHALRNSVQNALSGWNRPSAAPAQKSSFAPLPNTNAASSHRTIDWTQSAPSQVSATTSRYLGTSFATQSTGLNGSSGTPFATQAFIPAEVTTRVAPPALNSTVQAQRASQSAYSQPRTAQPAQSPEGLTPEIRTLLISFMMKNPESTSVPALHKAYEYHRGRISINTLLSWLISMKECLVIGADKGRVYMRPEHRPTLPLPIPSASVSGPSSQTRTIDPHGVPTVPPALNGAAPKETLRITVQTTSATGQASTNGWQRFVETTATTDGAAYESPTSVAETPPFSGVTKPSNSQGQILESHLGDADRVLEGISGLCVTDIIDVIEMMRRRPKIPLDQLLSEFEETFQRKIEPTDGVEGLVDSLSRLGLLKVAPNSDVSLFPPSPLRTFEYEPGQWMDVSDDDGFWNKFMESGTLSEGISMTGKVASYNESGFTFTPNWCPPDHLYRRTGIQAGGEYVYSNGQQKLRAIVHASISMAGHWLIYLPDLKKYKPCRKEQLLVGPPQPLFDVIPIGRCPPVGEDVKLKIVQVGPDGTTFACIDKEEPCCSLKSKVDSNFKFRIIHWDNQRFIPREDLAKLSLDKGLTSMDWTAIGNGEFFAAGSWMKDISDPFFIPMVELIELLETEGFREDAIHDLLLI